MKSEIIKMMMAALALISFGLVGCEGKKEVKEDAKTKEAITVKDDDGNEYPAVKIGNQVWMAKNLNVALHGSACYGDDAADCEKYGRLYTWEAAMKACPRGWHLPSKNEYEILLEYVGSSKEERSINLRAINWNNGTDKYGFSALPAGCFETNFINAFRRLGDDAYFWSSREHDNRDAYLLVVFDGGANVLVNQKNELYSVRCLQD